MFPIYRIVKVIFFTSSPLCYGFFFSFSTPAKIEPAGDVIKYVGESFSLTCSAILLNTTPTTFLRNGQPVSNIQIVDSRIIKLDIHNATLDDSGEYICRGIKGDSVTSLDIKHVLIAYPLEAPVFITCINYNGEAMNCSFQLNRYSDDTLLEHVNISYSIGNANELYLPKDHITIINRTIINCEWKNDDTNIEAMFNNKLKHKVKIVLYSRKDTITADYTIDPYIYVKPGPVKELNMISNTTKTSFTATVEWSPPLNQDACQTGNLVYNISIVRNDMIVSSKKIEPDCSEQDLLVSVNDLVPYTRYTVKVTCKPVNDGYWSDEAKIHITTPITAPKNGPGILEDYYSAVLNPDGSRTVAVYWQDYKLDKQGGPILNYIVTILPLDEPHWIQGNVRSMTMDLPPGEITVHVQAKTKAGSSPTSTLVIPTEENASVVVTDVIVEKWNDTSYNLTWEKLNNHQPNSNIKIYYCEGRLPPSIPIVQCLTALRTPFFNNNGNGALVTIPETLSGRCKDCEIYFAVSMNTNTTSNGLIWSVCYFNYFGDAAEPVLSVSADVDSISVKWQRICGRTKSRPTIFQLSYHQYQYHTTDCGEGKTVNVSREQTQHTIEGLNSGTKYLLCLKTITEVDSSDWVMKNITTSPIVTETEVNYKAISLLIALFLLLFVPVVCICVCKIRRGCKRSYVVKNVALEKTYNTASYTYDEIEEAPHGNGMESTVLHSNSTEEVTLDSNGMEATPLDSSIETDPLDSNNIEADPLDSNLIVRDTLDISRIVRDTLDSNNIEADPLDSNLIVRDTLDSSRIVRDTLDSSRIVRDTRDSNRIDTDPLNSHNIEADSLDSNSMEPDPLHSNCTERGPTEDCDYLQVATTFDPYLPHTCLNGHCEITTLEDSEQYSNSSGYKDQHFYSKLG